MSECTLCPHQEASGETHLITRAFKKRKCPMCRKLIEPRFAFDVEPDVCDSVPSYNVRYTCFDCRFTFEEHWIVDEDWVANDEFKEKIWKPYVAQIERHPIFEPVFPLYIPAKRWCENCGKVGHIGFHQLPDATVVCGSCYRRFILGRIRRDVN